MSSITFEVYIKIEYSIYLIDKQCIPNLDEIRNRVMNKCYFRTGLNRTYFGKFYVSRSCNDNIDSNFIYCSIFIEAEDKLAEVILEYITGSSGIGCLVKINDEKIIISDIGLVTIGEIINYGNSYLSPSDIEESNCESDELCE